MEAGVSCLLRYFGNAENIHLLWRFKKEETARGLSASHVCEPPNLNPEPHETSAGEHAEGFTQSEMILFVHVKGFPHKGNLYQSV